MTSSPPTAIPPTGGLQRRSSIVQRPSLPTAILPKIPRSLINSPLQTGELLRLITHLRSLYSTKDDLPTPALSSDVDEEQIDPLGPDSQFERGWTKSWLVSLLRKGEEWVQEVPETTEDDQLQEERKLRAQVIDEAGQLVASLTETSASGSILRPLLLPTSLADPPTSEPLLITLNDALPSSLDPTSVGLQSWGSSIILSKLICLNPTEFGVPSGHGEGSLHRTLELGAGTGLLSLVWKGMSERMGATGGEVVATDFHEDVLKNLRLNVETNTPVLTPSVSPLNSPPFLPADAKRTAVPGAATSLSGPPSRQSSAHNSGTGTPVVSAHHLDWSAVHSSRKFANAFPSSAPSTPLLGPDQPPSVVPTLVAQDPSVTMPPPFDRPFNTLLAADVVYGPEHARWLKSCVEQFLIKPNSTASTGPNPPTSYTGVGIVQPAPLDLQALEELDLNEPKRSRPASRVASPMNLSAPPSGASTPAPLPTSSSASSPSPFAPGTISTPPPESLAPSPAFHLIVPLRPTHTAAIATLDEVFPRAEDLPARKEGEPGRVAVKRHREVGRERGVGRSDEASYRLFEIGWC